MPLPHPTITPIPNNEPDAVPSLWNVRYQEIDANFDDHERRLSGRELELQQARSNKVSLGARLAEMDSNIGATSVDMQNATAAALKFALEQAAQANHGVRALRQHAQQEGAITIRNRGIVSGCAASKSTTAARNLNLSPGACFANGRLYSVASGNNAASVPSNTGAGPVTVYAYLFLDGSSQWRLSVTPIGTPVPEGAIVIYHLTVPAGNTDATDPNLANVAMADVRRFEPAFPRVLDNPVSASAALLTMAANDYHLQFDVVSAVGAPCDADQVQVASRATNGFTVRLASAADNVVVRWRASKLNT